jgi:hypothetical protein
MTDFPARRRGRPTNEERAARQEALNAKSEKDTAEQSFLDEKLNQPYRKRRSDAKLNPDEDTLRLLFELARLFCTQDEAAAVLGVTKRTLTTFFNEFPESREAWDDGQQGAKVSLRRKQLTLADKNAPAAIFLGKNYLGQKDESTTNLNVTKDVKKMSEDELLEIAARGSKPEAPKKDSVH